MIAGELTALRPFTEADADMLVSWHADPEVSRFWDDETYTRETLLAELGDDDVEPWIVEADGEPVGYIQAWWEGADPVRSGGGVDMFLVPGARGRGLGPDAARAFALHLLRERGWARVTVDPYVWNERAVAAWRKAGFRELSRHEPDAGHTSRWILMVFAP